MSRYWVGTAASPVQQLGGLLLRGSWPSSQPKLAQVTHSWASLSMSQNKTPFSAWDNRPGGTAKDIQAGREGQDR